MWFKRRKKTEQDHALSESLRSLQSLLSENGRREPSLEPRKAGGIGGDEPATSASTPTAPEERSGRTTAGNVEARAGSEPGNRWRDLNLSFDAEPAVPRTRRDGDAEEDQDQGEPSATANESGSGPDTPSAEAVVDAELRQGESVQPEAGTGTAPDPTPENEHAPESTAHALETRRDAVAEASAAEEAGDPGPDAGEQASVGESPVVYYDDFTVLPHEVEEDDREMDEPGLSGDEPDLEIDLSEAEDEQEAEEAESLDIETPAEPDEEAIQASGPAQALDDPDPGDTAEQATAAPTETAQRAESQPGELSAAATAPAAGQAGEDQLHLELGLEDVSEDDIPTLTDAVYVPGSRSVDDPEISEPEEADAPAPGVEAARAGQNVVEADEPEPPVEEYRAPAAAGDSAESPEPAPEAPAAAPDEPDTQMPLPDHGPSPHDEKVERCIDNLRVRLQLMGLASLSAGQENELRDTLVDLLDEVEPE